MRQNPQTRNVVPQPKHYNHYFATSVLSTSSSTTNEDESEENSPIQTHPVVRVKSHATPTVEPKHTYVVAMSGGVDSSVAAAMLVDQQRNNTRLHLEHESSKSEIVALHMSNWNRHDDDCNTQSSCTSLQDFHDVQSITQDILHIPTLEAYNDETTYWCHVFEPFIHNLLHYGMMGNPDIDCNTFVKFHSLLQHVLKIYGRETTLVTGHYARLWYRRHNNYTIATTNLHWQLPNVPESVEEMVQQHPEYIKELDWLRTWGSTEGGSNHNNDSSTLTPLLLSARDSYKDQSYFLAGVHPEAFHHVHFPIGDYFKNIETMEQQQPQQQSVLIDSHTVHPKTAMINDIVGPRSLSVREMATLYKLKPVEKKRDSTGLCFVGNQKHNRTSTITDTGRATTPGFTNFISNYLPIPHTYLQYINVETNEIVHETTQPQHAVLVTPGQGMKVPGGRTKYFCVDNHYSSATYQKNFNTGGTIARPSLAKQYHPITVCPGTNHSSLYTDCIYVDDIHWLCTVPPPQLWYEFSDFGDRARSMEGIQCRTRHLHPLTDCSITIPSSYPSVNRLSSLSKISEASKKQHHHRRYLQFETKEEEEQYNVQYRIAIQCHTPIRAVTPGQRVVFYTVNGLICLGSAVIVSKSRSYYELGNLYSSRR